MEKIIQLKNMLLLVSGLFFVAASFAETTPPKATMTGENIASVFAEKGRSFLLQQNKTFPIKIDNLTYLTNLSSDKNTIVYDYTVAIASDIFSKEDMTNNLKKEAKANSCPNKTLVAVSKKYDIHFLHRYQFDDNKTVPILLSIEELCE